MPVNSCRIARHPPAQVVGRAAWPVTGRSGGYRILKNSSPLFIFRHFLKIWNKDADLNPAPVPIFQPGKSHGWPWRSQVQPNSSHISPVLLSIFFMPKFVLLDPEAPVLTWPATKQGIRVHFVAVQVTPVLTTTILKIKTQDGATSQRTQGHDRCLRRDWQTSRGSSQNWWGTKLQKGRSRSCYHHDFCY